MLIIRALGDAATDDMVQRLESDAAALEISIPQMLQIHRPCAFDPAARPSSRDLRAARDAATLVKGDGHAAMVALARVRCQ
ncbi:MAG: hypothetical protein EXR79_11825 [Myxococcales bacterium]|nr:hypothetical protein [Myxococcales bacterium]